MTRPPFSSLPRHLPDRRVPSGARPRTREHALTVAAWLAALLVA
ncbi:phosphate ABC transporter permease, partial [Desulfovibrio sp. XJ01]|nr:phosphate ABC transporter permease [Nitratidesulfovibrio liaohensis]